VGLQIDTLTNPLKKTLEHMERINKPGNNLYKSTLKQLNQVLNKYTCITNSVFLMQY